MTLMMSIILDTRSGPFLKFVPLDTVLFKLFTPLHQSTFNITILRFKVKAHCKYAENELVLS